ncbi:SLBB domain-containing protein [uncultured Paludibaculum sp.]|uniref:SLBB domain-containing protein n=1 Tax=uncultured Paludibaculum sp. TaxID=1765020 RepID=UPI002AAB6695|nr:SLBB domain-containing protein [uncultured Paludibaculum sp.]
MAALSIAAAMGQSTTVPGDLGLPQQEDAQALAARCAAPGSESLPECQAAQAALRRARAQAQAQQSGMAPQPETEEPKNKDTQELKKRDDELEPKKREPEPPSEFQRFVASSFGKTLPIFGMDLFERAPAAFTPIQQSPITSSYVIGPGDELQLRLWGQISQNLTLTVDRAGQIFVPQAGNITVAGMSYQQMQSHLREELSRVFRNFEFSVTLGQLRSISVLVVGQARQPGSYTVNSLSTLLNAVFASGGPSATGSLRHIQLKRNGALVTELDLYDLLLNGDQSKDARLLPGDVIYIPTVGPQVAIAGSVKHPAIYELNGATDANAAIAMAGGLSSIAEGHRAVLERIKDRAARETTDLALDGAGPSTPLRDGDLLRIQTVLPRFENAVTLRGHVANPGRFAWRSGMRIRDLIPDEASLITRDYWNKRNLLGYVAPEDTVAGDPKKVAAQARKETRLEITAPSINWAYAVVERQNAQALQAELLPFNLGKMLQERDESQNLELRPGDVVTIFSQDDVRVPVSLQTRFVRLEGEIRAAGIYTIRPGETLGQLIERAGGLMPDAYLFGSEFQRESTRKEQQRRLDELTRDLQREVEQTGTALLGGASTPQDTATLTTRTENERRMVEAFRATQATGRIVLRLDPAGSDVSKLMGLVLEGGDRFVVPPRPATVNVLGAVYNSNSFIHEGNLRVADYLRQAGGCTRNADKGRMFIIRADGSVVPKQGSSSPFTKAFDATRLNPGDSLVIPQQMFKTPFLRGLRDWSQVFGQLALGAAAINILR